MRLGPRWVPVLALAVLVGPLVTGSSQAATTDVVPGSDPAALALLGGAVRAETALTYGGVEVVTDSDDGSGDTPDGLDSANASGSAGTNVDHVIDVSHVAGEGTVLFTDGAGSATRAGFLGADVRRPDLLIALLQRSYRLMLGGAGAVAGRPAHVVVAQRPDGRVAARFWLDDATGLLLRREVMDRSGRTSASLVLSLVQRPEGAVAYLPPLLPAVRPASLDSRAVASWAARGYPCPEQVGGLTLFDVRTVPGTGSGVLHLTYSDGLSTVSVFVQRGRLDGDEVPGARRADVSGQAVLVVAGHPRQLLWGAGGFVLTVVADSDRDVVAGVVADLPHTGAAPTGWARVERGVARVVSWVDPFD